MIIVLLLVFVALIVVWRKGRAWPFQLPLIGLLVLIAVGLLVVRILTISGGSDYSGDFEEAAGYMLAAKVKETYPDVGQVVVIQQQGALKHIQSVCDAQIRGIRRQLEDEFKWPIHRTGPVFEFSQQGIDTMMGFSSETCAEWLRDVPDAIAVISFLGLPSGPMPEGEKKAPPYCALMPGKKEDARWGKGIEVLTVAAHRPGINPLDVPARGATEQDVFNMRFEWVAEPPSVATGEEE